MSTVAKKPRLKTSAMIASIAAEGQVTRSAPFGHALAQLARTKTNVIGMTADLGSTPTCTSSRRNSLTATTRWAWPSSF